MCSLANRIQKSAIVMRGVLPLPSLCMYVYTTAVTHHRDGRPRGGGIAPTHDYNGLIIMRYYQPNRHKFLACFDLTTRSTALTQVSTFSSQIQYTYMKHYKGQTSHQRHKGVHNIQLIIAEQKGKATCSSGCGTAQNCTSMLFGTFYHLIVNFISKILYSNQGAIR